MPVLFRSVAHYCGYHQCPVPYPPFSFMCTLCCFDRTVICPSPSPQPRGNSCRGEIEAKDKTHIEPITNKATATRTLIHAWTVRIVQPIMHIQPSEFSLGVISHYLHLISMGARLNSCPMLFRLYAVLQIPPETLRSTLMYSEGRNNTEGHCGS